MRMHAVDWGICIALLAVLLVAALIFRPFSRSVTGFLAANRCAGRYLLCVAYNMAQVGIITLVWFFQQYYDSGWTSIWWGFLENPSMIALALSGWVIYRFRETRALTLAQFFEQRYSRSFRVFCGIVAFVAGVVNYAIFPAVSARFFMGMCGFPEHFTAIGTEWNTYIVIMAVLLSLALLFVFIGGQIAVMVTDFLQGVFCNAVFLVLIAFCLITFGWARISDTMTDQYWQGQAVTWQVDVPKSALSEGSGNWNEQVKSGLLGAESTLVKAQEVDAGTVRFEVTGRPDPRARGVQAAAAAGKPALLLNGQPAGVAQGPPEGKSMVHPFRIQNEDNFNIAYWLISAFILFYAAKAWQGDQGYNAAALNPHEAKMAQILSGWRWRVLMLVALVVPVCVKVFMHHPDFAAGAAAVQSGLDSVVANAAAQNPNIDAGTVASLTSEMRTPLALAEMLPIGMMGLVAAAMFGAYLSTDDTYLHSWGSILVQDVLLPNRKKPLSPRAHIWLLRCAICAVAIFAFVVGIYYKPGQYIAMYGALTAAIFVAGAGVCIVGGLYWRRGTTQGAWAAMLTGMATALFALAAKEGALISSERLRVLSDDMILGGPAQLMLNVRESALLTGQVLGFIAIALAIGVYVVVSYATSARAFDLDRLLHRGKFRDEHSGSALSTDPDAAAERGRRTIWERLGFTREFSGSDKWITWITIGWPLFWTVVFVVFSVYNIFVDVPSRSWMDFWRWWTVSVFVLGVVIVVWFSIGGFRDLIDMYRRLKAFKPDVRDDGTVEERRE